MTEGPVLNFHFDPVAIEAEVRNERGDLIEPDCEGIVTIPESGTYSVRQRWVAPDGRYSESFGTIERD
jgi:hypothetical protein